MHLQCLLPTNILNNKQVRNELVKLLLINLTMSNYIVAYTTINVKPETFEILKRRAVYGQTMDGIILWMLDKIPENHLEPRCINCNGLLTAKIGTDLISCTNCNQDFRVNEID